MNCSNCGRLLVEGEYDICDMCESIFYDAEHE
jgi:RNA polymerase subunit RPABC4/transcription elongation factor Spt4